MSKMAQRSHWKTETQAAYVIVPSLPLCCSELIEWNPTYLKQQTRGILGKFRSYRVHTLYLECTCILFYSTVHYRDKHGVGGKLMTVKHKLLMVIKNETD